MSAAELDCLGVVEVGRPADGLAEKVAGLAEEVAIGFCVAAGAGGVMVEFDVAGTLTGSELFLPIPKIK